MPRDFALDPVCWHLKTLEMGFTSDKWYALLMKKLEVDVAIIGTGTAGMGAYRASLEHTDSIAVIEAFHYGTTCARVGCMPSKLLIAAAEAAYHAAHTEPFGVSLKGEILINGREVMQRVRSERDRFVGFVLESVESFNPNHRIRGYGRFLDPHTLQVDDHTQISAKSIVIATGSAPSYPAHLKHLGDALVVNDDVFDWEDLPESTAVIGPGVIGLELGQALHRLGVRTTVFGRGGRVGIVTDPELKAICRKVLSSEFDLQYCADLQSLKRVGEQVEIEFLDNEKKPRKESYAKVLVATGRTPNLDINLENSGLELGERGVPKFDSRTMQCSDSHIFIAGDVNNKLLILHEASDEGRIAGANAATYPSLKPGFRRAPLFVVFSDPQMAIAGSSYSELKDGSQDFITGAVSFENQGRSRVMRVNQGGLRVYFQAETSKLLGAEIFGPRAENLGHLLAWSCQQGLDIDELLAMPFYHPVIEEGLRAALRDAKSKLS
jgi:dihydrolipoamide dehydrogenase